MLGDADLQNPPAIVADDKEAVEDAEGDGGNGEEVHGRNRFSVIRKKRAPALGWPGLPRGPFHPARDGSLRNLEPQHKKLTVDPRSTPTAVLRHHTEDQLPNVRRQLFPTDPFSRRGDPTPVPAKPRTMPADDRLWMDEHEGLLPSTPETTGEDPKDFVNRPHPRPGMLALQHGQLLPKSEILQEQASMRSQAAGEQAQA